MSQKRMHILSTLALLAFVILAFGSLSEKSEENGVAKTPPTFNVAASALCAEYSANEVAADTKYKDKVLVVHGIVKDIGKGMGSMYVVLQGDDRLDLQCFFADDMTDAVAKLSKGESVAVKGRCDGEMMNVVLRGCVGAGGN